jgi:hypothetical protein
MLALAGEEVLSLPFRFPLILPTQFSLSASVLTKECVPCLFPLIPRQDLFIDTIALIHLSKSTSFAINEGQNIHFYFFA